MHIRHSSIGSVSQTTLLHRRSLLAGGALALLGAAAPLSATKLLFGHGARPLGINLYMLAAALRTDLDGTLRSVADIGYSEVETNFDVFSPERLKVALGKAGLRCSNLGILPKPLRGGLSLDDVDALADGAHQLGAAYLTCNLFPLPDGVVMRPQTGESVPQMLARVTSQISIDHWRRTADYLNAKGQAFKRRGLKFAYHNHNAELAPHGETNGLAILLEYTDPTLVDFHMDAGWIVAAGQDPVAFLRGYTGRFRLMHVKDISSAHRVNSSMAALTTEVGSGIVNWARVIATAVDCGVRHFAVEQEPPYAIPEIEAARKSFAYLKALRI